VNTVKLCKKYRVPVLINDRIDIALASQADGVHLGQTDMPIKIARKLLPPNSIIGISCTKLAHVTAAIENRADYVGLGAIFPTTTKDVTKEGRVCGIDGARNMLAALEGTGIKAVAIGLSRRQRLLRISDLNF
jgi:thiamine-phosphate diphosphorylase / hydroxyethylthiazole kinase